TVRRRLGGGGRAAADNIGAAACRVWHDEPDRPRRERFRPANGSGQNHRRTAEQRKEGAAFHSITSSARASSVGGTSRPSALAGLRLMTSSCLVGACAGRSDSLSPLRVRAT